MDSTGVLKSDPIPLIGKPVRLFRSFLVIITIAPNRNPMIEFRKVKIPEELGALQRLDEKIFAAFPGDLFTQEEWESFESHWMIADGAIAGCSALVHDVDYDESPRPGCLHIVSTGVVPEARMRGLGRKLKEWQIEYARSYGFEVIVTNMRQSNYSIIRLNEALGFQRRLIHPAFYEDPLEDAIVMELRLSLTRGGGKSMVPQ
jgi:ribosomal protein S18 acetylase RimI-like enzyme